MCAHTRDVLVLPALLCVVGGVLGCLVSCTTPLKGYPGPERPREHIAIVSVAHRDIDRATVDGKAFGAAGIQLLPGHHTFALSVSEGQSPYDCKQSQGIDTYRYDQCRKEREDDIKKRKKASKECPLSAYTQYRKRCLRDYRLSDCEMTLSLAPGKAYELDILATAATPPMVFAYRGSGQTREALPALGTCRFVGTRTRLEEGPLSPCCPSPDSLGR